MSRDASLEADFGDGGHQFRLAIGELREMEEKRDAGSPLILRRLLSGEWRVDDVREVIRLGLIGGGMPALEALKLVRRYVDDIPAWTENAMLAGAILGAALMGVEDEEPGKPQAGEAKHRPRSRAKKPASPKSTATEP